MERVARRGVYLPYGRISKAKCATLPPADRDLVSNWGVVHFRKTDHLNLYIISGRLLQLYPYRPNVEFFSLKYKLPPSIELSHFWHTLSLGHHKHLEDGAIVVTLGQIACGLKFPLSPFFRNVCRFYNVHPGQFVGNSYRIISCFERIYNDSVEQGDADASMDDIFYCSNVTLNIKPSVPHDVGYIELGRKVKDKRKTTVHVKKCASTNKEWGDFPVVVHGQWEFGDDELDHEGNPTDEAAETSVRRDLCPIVDVGKGWKRRIKSLGYSEGYKRFFQLPLAERKVITGHGLDGLPLHFPGT